MNIKIRRVSIEDLDAVTEVEASCFPEAEAAAKASFGQRIKRFPESFFVAEIDEKVIGFINGCIINETTICDELFSDATLHIPNGVYQTIFGLDVISDYRNQGIAAQLMNHLIEVSRLSGRKGVSKSEHGGSEWYDMILKF